MEIETLHERPGGSASRATSHRRGHRTIGSDGKVRIERNLLKPRILSGRAAQKGPGAAAGQRHPSPLGRARSPPDGASHAGLQRTLARRPEDCARGAHPSADAQTFFVAGFARDSALQSRLKTSALNDYAETWSAPRRRPALEALRKQLGAGITGGSGWPCSCGLLEQPQAQGCRFWPFCVATTLDGVQSDRYQRLRRARASRRA